MPAYNEASDVARPRNDLKLSDIPAHDPFVLPHARDGVY